MKNLTIIACVCIGFMLIIGINSCQHGQCEAGETSNSGENSHNQGKNCLNCHIADGEGEGCFTVAGTVYNNSLLAAYTIATIKLYTGPNGTGSLVTTLETDSRGNFYTGSAVSFKSHLYPSVTDANGQTIYMAAGISTGACNSCHNISQDKIYVK